MQQSSISPPYVIRGQYSEIINRAYTVNTALQRATFNPDSIKADQADSDALPESVLPHVKAENCVSIYRPRCRLAALGRLE